MPKILSILIGLVFLISAAKAEDLDNFGKDGVIYMPPEYIYGHVDRSDDELFDAGMAYYERGNVWSAMNCFEEYYSRNKDKESNKENNLEVLSKLSSCYWLTQKLVQMKEVGEEMLKLDSSYYPAFSTLSSYYCATKDYETGLFYLEKKMATYDDSVRYRLLMPYNIIWYYDAAYYYLTDPLNFNAAKVRKTIKKGKSLCSFSKELIKGLPKNKRIKTVQPGAFHEDTRDYLIRGIESYEKSFSQLEWLLSQKGC